MTDQPEEETGQVRPFADVLRDINRGLTADQAGTDMQRLVAAVQEYGKKGTLTIVVTVEPLKNNESALAVSGEVTLKAPKAPARANVFFADKAGNLMRDDPRQAVLPGIRVISTTVNLGNVKEMGK